MYFRPVVQEILLASKPSLLAVVGFAGEQHLLTYKQVFRSICAPPNLTDFEAHRTTAENFAIGYPFRFATPGWYMFVVNQTYMQANVVSDCTSEIYVYMPTEKQTENNQCTWPILQQKSFFATQIFSLAAYPTVSPGPISPTSAYTVWADVSTTTPSSLPIDVGPTTKGQKLGLALGIAGGVLGLAIIASVIWWVRKKRNLEAEASLLLY